MRTSNIAHALVVTTAAVAAVVIGAGFFYAPAARACGGLFCSGSAPVDQSSEQVLFEVDDDNTITATVQINYSGDDPRAFSWIIPVHGTPDFVGIAPREIFKWLDVTTRPAFIAPPVDDSQCNYDDYYGDEGEGEGGGEGEGEGEGVDVVHYDDVGPYDDIVVVDGRDPETLISWLSENGYVVTDSMRPVIEEYAIENQKFLALKLQPDVDVNKIVPVRFHCPNPLPVVPSRLTSLAAEPHMGMVVTLLSSQRFTPTNSWSEASVDGNDLVWRGYGGYYDYPYENNYASLVALRVDEAGGKAFVVERAGASGFIRDTAQQQLDYYYNTDDDVAAGNDLVALVNAHPYVTRFYTRISAEEMTDDPQFRAAPELGDVSGVLDSSGQAPFELCVEHPPAPSPCAFLYCGVGAQCGLIDENTAGCLCAPGFGARAITPADSNRAAGGVKDVACVDGATNVMTTIDAGCDGVTCGGHGACSAVNGTPSCLCDAGTIAFADPWSLGGVSCAEAVELRGNDDIRSSTTRPRVLLPTDDGAPTFGCHQAGGEGAALGALGVVALATVRRRRRHARV